MVYNSSNQLHRYEWLLCKRHSEHLILPMIPDPMMELIKLKDADIIELLGSPATFCGGINVIPCSLFNWKTRKQSSD